MENILFRLDYTLVTFGFSLEDIKEISGSLEVSAVVGGNKINVGGIKESNLLKFQEFSVRLPTDLDLVQSIGLTYRLPADGRETGGLIIPFTGVVSDYRTPIFVPEKLTELVPDKELVYTPYSEEYGTNGQKIKKNGQNSKEVVGISQHLAPLLTS